MSPRRRSISSTWTRLVAPLGVGFVLLTLALPLSSRLEASLGDMRDDVELALFPKSGWIRPLTFGRAELAADYVWLRTIQYYGEHRITDQQYPYVKSLLATLIELDPHFINGYVFGSLVITEDLGQPMDAIRFLKQGMEHNPDSWWLPFEIGVVHYIHRRDHASAAPWLAQAAEMEGAPESTSRLAAYAAQKGGDHDVAEYLWLEIYAQADNDEIRRVAYGYLQELGHPDFLAPNPYESEERS